MKSVWPFGRSARRKDREAREDAAVDRALRGLFAETGAGPEIDEARVEHIVAGVLRRLPARPAPRPSLVAHHAYRLATLIVTAALLGVVAGWYSAAVFDGTTRSDFAMLLWAPFEHPFEL